MIIKIKQGFINFRRVGKAKHRLYELQRVEIYEQYRRKGYEEKLFESMIKRISPYRKLFCTTHKSNKIAHKFYEKMGMGAEAILPDHYYEGEPEVVYSLYSPIPTNKNKGVD